MTDGGARYDDPRWVELFGRYPRKVLDRCAKFHVNNPQVWPLFKRAATQMKATGRKKYGARRIMEAIRWEIDLKRPAAQPFKINGDFVPIYARWLIYNHPEFKGFLELRAVRSRGIKSEEERRREGTL
jgi:hypothetical protein